MNDNAQKLALLMEEHGLNKGQVSRMLSRVTGDEVSHRRVRTWFAPETVHAASRAECPGWAITCLLLALTMEGHIAPDTLFQKVFEFY